MAGDGDRGGLVAGGVDFDLVLEGVVVEVICREEICERLRHGRGGERAERTKTPCWYRLVDELTSVLHATAGTGWYLGMSRCGWRGLADDRVSLPVGDDDGWGWLAEVG